MGIIAQRQRRRFQQVRRLGIVVPLSYKRIHSIRRYPNAVQTELVKYPETIAEDSEYESDTVVLRRYAEDPVAYIKKKDDRHRDAIEMNGEPRRLWAARSKRGEKNHDLAMKIRYDAAHAALEKQGLHREMTMDRRFGNHIKRFEQTQASYYQQGYEKEIAFQLYEHAKTDPNIFVNERETVDILLKEFKEDITILK